MGACCSKGKRRRRKKSKVLPTYRKEENNTDEEEIYGNKKVEDDEKERREPANPFDKIQKNTTEGTTTTTKRRSNQKGQQSYNNKNNTNTTNKNNKTKQGKKQESGSRSETFIERLKRERREEMKQYGGGNGNNTAMGMGKTTTQEGKKKEPMASYQHDKLNFQFEYPKTWRVDNVPVKNTVFILSPTEQLTSFQDHIAIRIHFSAKGAKQYIRELQEQMEYAPRYEELKRIKKTSMKHLKGYGFKCQYTLGNNKRELVQKTIVCEGGDSLLYVFTYSSDNGYHSARYLFNMLSEGMYFQYKQIPMTCVKTPNIHLYFPPYWKGKGATMLSPIDTTFKPERVVIQKMIKQDVMKDYQLRGETMLKQHLNSIKQLQQQEPLSATDDDEEDQQPPKEGKTTQEEAHGDKKDNKEEVMDNNNKTTIEENKEENEEKKKENEEKKKLEEETLHLLKFVKLKLIQEYEEKYDQVKVHHDCQTCFINNKPGIFFEVQYKQRMAAPITPFVSSFPTTKTKVEQEEETKDHRPIIHQPVFTVIANNHIWNFQYMSGNKKISARLFRNMMKKFVLTPSA